MDSTIITIKKGSNVKNYSYLPCVECGDIRRVQIIKGKPRFTICRKCSSARNSIEGNWKGGVLTKPNGARLVHIPDHPQAMSRGYVYEHRLVMEQKLGRYLSPEEVIHHINFNTGDNRPENLMLFANDSEHIKYHMKLKRDEKSG